jgi:hypothetical protein
MEGLGSGYIMEREKRCEIKIETSGARGASGLSTTWNLKQGILVWSGDADPEHGIWGASAEMEREEKERGQGSKEAIGPWRSQ